MSKQDAARQNDAAVSFVVAGIGTWALTNYILVPIFGALGMAFSWWMYLIVFLVLMGGIVEALAKNRALQKVAYGKVDTVASNADATYCSKCGSPFIANDPFCSKCGAKNPLTADAKESRQSSTLASPAPSNDIRGVYGPASKTPQPGDSKRGVVAILLVVIAVSFYVAFSSSGSPSAPSAPPPSGTSAPPAPGETPGQNNARRSAQQYLSNQAFSRAGLIKQLSSSYGEGFSIADATYGVDSLNVDWNEQAAKSAQQYLSNQAFSRAGLIRQLESSHGEGFTHSQAVHGVSAAGL